MILESETLVGALNIKRGFQALLICQGFLRKVF